MTPKFHPLRIAEVRRETPDAISLRFELPGELSDDYRFVQGQHLTLKAKVQGEELRRSYSICAGVDDGELRVAIKKIGGGRFSTWANDALKAGDVIDVMTPEGRFHTELDPANARHYVAFAAGSGITPILSLIKTTLKAEPDSRFTLIYGNRRQASIIFAEALEDIKDRYMTRFTLYHVFSREEQEVPLFNGRLDRERVAASGTGRRLSRYPGARGRHRCGLHLRSGCDDRRSRGGAARRRRQGREHPPRALRDSRQRSRAPCRDR